MENFLQTLVNSAESLIGFHSFVNLTKPESQEVNPNFPGIAYKVENNFLDLTIALNFFYQIKVNIIIRNFENLINQIAPKFNLNLRNATFIVEGIKDEK
ncbi:hypothetical protein ACA758_01245 [Mycoplasmopsis agassizii]|uniref:hypothetical protein n=1 Tax=Mycoplasmopsis agassizii TaxID=33922 RepID=UPI00352937F3